MTRDLDTHWKLHWVLLSWQELGKWMSCMAWIEWTILWIFSHCDLGEVSGYTPSKGCVGLRVYGLHTGVRGHVANMCSGS